MMTVTPYITLPDIVPQAELNKWKQKNRQFWMQASAPPEVKEFIEALADKLGDFAQFRSYQVYWSGRALGLNQYDGQPIDPNAVYPVQVPVMQAVDYCTTMMRIYKKRGKQGLIDFCKAKVQGSELERALEILTVHVFHQERPEFRDMIERISKSKNMEEAWPAVREFNALRNGVPRMVNPPPPPPLKKSA